MQLGDRLDRSESHWTDWIIAAFLSTIDVFDPTDKELAGLETPVVQQSKAICNRPPQ
jgi:hypothetical protein